MADSVDQTEDTAPNLTDILYSVRDPGGSPLDRKMTLQTLQNTLEIVTKVASAVSALTDNAKMITMNVGTTNSYTLQANGTVAHPIGTSILIQQIGVGVTSVVAASGVTLQGGGASVLAGSCDIAAQYDTATCVKTGADIWVIQGAVGGIT